jgi:hypothetical protein
LGEDAAADLFEAGFGGRVPAAVFGGVEPEFEENVIGFEGDVGEEFSAPVAVGELFVDEGTGAGFGGGAGGVAKGLAFFEEFAYYGPATERLLRGKDQTHSIVRALRPGWVSALLSG